MEFGFFSSISWFSLGGVMQHSFGCGSPEHGVSRRAFLAGTAGALGALGLGVLGWGIDSLFALMACGLVVYGLVMVAVMRRELGLYPGGR